MLAFLSNYMLMLVATYTRMNDTRQIDFLSSLPLKDRVFLIPLNEFGGKFLQLIIW